MKKSLFIICFSFLVGCSPLHISMQEQGPILNMDERAYISTTGASGIQSINGEPTRNFFEFVAGLFQKTSSVDVPAGETNAGFIMKKTGYKPAFANIDFVAKKGGKYQFEYDWGYSTINYRLIDMDTKKPVGKYKK